MASEHAMARVSELFGKFYGKPIPEDSFDEWVRKFANVPDGVLTKAAELLTDNRDVMRAVAPGELTPFIKAAGGTVRRYKPEKGFKDDPIVKALDSRPKHEADEGGISLHEWLQKEGLTFQDAMRMYEGETSVVPVLEMAGATATIVRKPPDKDMPWEEIAQRVDDEEEGG